MNLHWKSSSFFLQPFLLVKRGVCAIVCHLQLSVGFVECLIELCKLFGGMVEDNEAKRKPLSCLIALKVDRANHWEHSQQVPCVLQPQMGQRKQWLLEEESVAKNKLFLLSRDGPTTGVLLSMCVELVDGSGKRSG